MLGEQAGVDTLPIVAGQTPVEIARRALQRAQAAAAMTSSSSTPPAALHVDEALMAEMADDRATSPTRTRPAGRRRADRPGRGQCRQELRRAGRHHRHRADPRWTATPAAARRCRCAPSPASRSSCSAPARSSTRSRISIPQPRRRPHPRHGRRRQPGRDAPPRRSTPRRRRRSPRKMGKGEFDLDDLAEQLQADAEDRRHVRRAWACCPASARSRSRSTAPASTMVFKRQTAIISSMTRPSGATRSCSRPTASSGSPPAPGTKVEEINRLLKMHRQMADMMKTMGKQGHVRPHVRRRTGPAE